MSTRVFLHQLTSRHGFTPSPRPGFYGAERGDQRCDIFRWKNVDVADRDGIPREYLVLCLTFTRCCLEDGGRWRLPLVEWPSVDQNKREWSDVLDEFDSVFLPLFDSTEFPRLDERYHL